MSQDEHQFASSSRNSPPPSRLHAYGIASQEDGVLNEALLPPEPLRSQATVSEQSQLSEENAALKADRILLRRLFDHDGDGYLVTTGDGIITEANRAAAELLASPHDSLVGMNLFDFVVGDAGDLLSASTGEWNQADLTREWDVRLRSRTGRIIDASLTVTAVHDGHGEVLSLGWRLRDIGKPKQSEQWLLMQQRVSRALSSSVSLNATLVQLLRIIGETMGWELGAFWEVNWESNVLQCCETWCTESVDGTHFESASRRVQLRPGQGPAGRVWASGEAAWFEDVFEAGEYPRIESYAQFNSWSAFVMPVLGGSTVVGVIEFLGRGFRPPDKELQHLATSLGLQIGHFIEHAWLEEERAHLLLQEQVMYADAERARQEVTEILESISDGFYVLDHEWRFTFLNKHAERILGKPREELLGKNVWDEYPLTRTMPVYDEYHRAVAEQVTVEFEIYYPRPYDFWADVRAYPSETGLSVYFRDVTEQKRANDRLRQAEEQYRALVEQIPAITYLSAPDATASTLYVSPQAKDILGFSPEECLNNPQLWLELLHPDDRERVLTEVKESLQEGDAYASQYRMHTRDGRILWIDDRGVIVRDVYGDPLIAQGIQFDITDRKEAEQALQETNQMLEAIIQASPLAIVVLDKAGRVKLVNVAAEDIFGWSQQELVGELPRFIPDERQTEYAEYLERVQMGDSFSIVERTLVKKDGSPVVVGISTAPLRDALGRISGSVGLLADITEERELEQELLMTQARLAQSREEERLRLARKLHDSAIQRLLGISYQLAEVRERLAVEHGAVAATEESVALLQSTYSETLSVVELLRHVIQDLRPAGLEEFGLSTALKGFIRRLERKNAQAMPEIELNLADVGTDLPFPVATCLFRVAQEALRNSLRHADAQRIRVTLHTDENLATLEVRDDGKGFHVPEHLPALTRDGHFGLVGMQERVTQVRGRFRIRSNEHAGGTSILVQIPLAQEGEGSG